MNMPHPDPNGSVGDKKLPDGSGWPSATNCTMVLTRARKTLPGTPAKENSAVRTDEVHARLEWQ